jgi:hypothetical protein
MSANRRSARAGQERKRALRRDPPNEPPDWLEDIEQPIVLVTTSSEFQDVGRLVRCALEAIASREGAIRIAEACRAAGGSDAAADLCEEQLRQVSLAERSR